MNSIDYQALGFFLIAKENTEGRPLVFVPSTIKDRFFSRALKNALERMSAAKARKEETLRRRFETTGEILEEEARLAILADFDPAVNTDKTGVPLQYLLGELRGLAGLVQTASIHSTEKVAEFKQLMEEMGIACIKSFVNLKFLKIGWSAQLNQRPKAMLFAEAEDGQILVMRFEGVSESGIKMLHAVEQTELKAGDIFSLAVDAIDPAVSRNEKAGKEVSPVGRYVNHNLVVTNTTSGKTSQGRPAGPFVQKVTEIEAKALFDVTVQAVLNRAA